jgi:hypothetical protein
VDPYLSCCQRVVACRRSLSAVVVFVHYLLRSLNVVRCPPTDLAFSFARNMIRDCTAGVRRRQLVGWSQLKAAAYLNCWPPPAALTVVRPPARCDHSSKSATHCQGWYALHPLPLSICCRSPLRDNDGLRDLPADRQFFVAIHHPPSNIQRPHDLANSLQPPPTTPFDYISGCFVEHKRSGG